MMTVTASIAAKPTYTIAEHQHRLAAWAAATAARASSKCRFEVQQGVAILEEAGFDASLTSPEALPEPSQIDSMHREWRVNVIAAAQHRGFTFSHGVAAKLINVYLKVRFVVAGLHDHPKVCALHPPIDRGLLEELARGNVGGARLRWKAAMMRGWSNYDSADYEQVIELIRSALPGQPLWAIEQYWKGFQ